MKNFLVKFGYIVENESGKADTRAIYVFFGFSVIYFLCSITNVIIDCISNTSSYYILGYIINFSIFLKILTLEYIRSIDVKKSVSPQNVVADHKNVIIVSRNKFIVYFALLFLLMLVLLIVAGYEKVNIKVWEFRGLCIYAILVSLIEDLFLLVEQKFKARMVPYTIIGG